MFRFLPVTLLLLFGAHRVLAGDAADQPVTFMGHHLLAKTDLVVRGAVTNVSRLSAGPTVASYEIREVLWGSARGESSRVSLFTADPNSFPAPGVDCVYFLERLGKGRYEPIGRIDITGKNGPSRLATLKAYLEIERLPEPGERRSALHDLLLANLVSGDDFKIFSAARELAFFTGQSPDSFTAEDRKTIQQKISLSRSRVLTDLLETALENLGGAPAPPSAPEEEGRPALPVAPRRTLPPSEAFRDLAAAWRRGGLDVSERRFVVRAIVTRHLAHAGPILLDALSDHDEEVRWLAALNLGEGLVAAAETPLLRMLSTEKDKRVLEAAIQSLGILGSEKALEPITEFARDPALVRSVAFAAARIGGDGADAFLDGLLATHPGTQEDDRQIRELIQFLRSKDFRRQEELLEKIRKKRLRGG